MQCEQSHLQVSCLPLSFSPRSAMQEGIATYEAALKLAPNSKDVWLNLGMACKEICWVERAEQVSGPFHAVQQRYHAAASKPPGTA